MSYVEKTLASKPAEANLGGIPSMQNKIRAFLSVKYQKMGQWTNLSLEVSASALIINRVMAESINDDGRLRIILPSGRESITCYDRVMREKRWSTRQRMRVTFKSWRRTLYSTSKLGWTVLIVGSSRPRFLPFLKESKVDVVNMCAIVYLDQHEIYSWPSIIRGFVTSRILQILTSTRCIN